VPVQLKHTTRKLPQGTLGWAAGAFAVLAVCTSYFTTLSRLENDHFVIIARARRVLDGGWPVRDFIDPGMPLTYLPSAFAAAIGGPTLLAEVVLCIALLGSTTAIAFFLIRRTTGSIALALGGAALILAFPTRLYSATKVATICIALLVGSRYALKPSRGRLVAFGAWTGVACLVRFDYAVYVAGAAAALWAFAAAPLKRRLSDGGLYVAIALAVVAPWLIYVQLVQGLPEYIGSAVRFAQQEGSRTASGPPWFEWPIAQAANTDPALFYLLLSVPLAGLALAARLPKSPARTELAYVSALALLSDVAFLRDAVADRMGDVIPQTAVTAAYVVAHLLPRRTFLPLGVATASLAAAVGVQSFLQQGGSLSPVEIARQSAETAGRLRRSDPELVTGPLFADLASYLARCTAPRERVIVSGFAPEIPILAGRQFAGGLPAWLLGYYVLPPDAQIIERHLRQEEVGAVVLLEGSRVFMLSWPTVARGLLDTGFQEYAFPADSTGVHLWLRPGAGTSATDAGTGLPCRPH
jgi:hypothetical protein